MTMQNGDHEKLLSRVRGLVERGERVPTDDVAALFNVTDTTALARIARLPRERRFGRTAFFIDVPQITYRGQSPASVMSLVPTTCSSVALEIVGAVDVDLLTSAVSALRRDHRVVICASRAWIGSTASASGSSVESVLRRLQAIAPVVLRAYDDSAVEDQERIAPHSLDQSQDQELYHAAPTLGIRTIATMVYHAQERPESYARQLDSIRNEQDDSECFISFIARPEHRNDLDASYKTNPSAHQSLRATAIARIALDNVAHIGVAPRLLTAEIAVIALSYGADTVDSISLRSSTSISATDATGMIELSVVDTPTTDVTSDRVLISSRIVEARFVATSLDASYSLCDQTTDDNVAAGVPERLTR